MQERKDNHMFKLEKESQLEIFQKRQAQRFQPNQVATTGPALVPQIIEPVQRNEFRYGPQYTSIPANAFNRGAGPQLGNQRGGLVLEQDYIGQTVRVAELTAEDGQRFRALNSFWRTFISPSDTQTVRWSRFEDGLYAFYRKKFLAQEGGRHSGENDGEMLVYGLFLSLIFKNELYIDVMMNSSGFNLQTNSEEAKEEHELDSNLESQELFLRPAMSILPQREFVEVSKKWFIGNALRLGLMPFCKAVIEDMSNILFKLTVSKEDSNKKVDAQQQRELRNEQTHEAIQVLKSRPFEERPGIFDEGKVAQTARIEIVPFVTSLPNLLNLFTGYLQRRRKNEAKSTVAAFGGVRRYYLDGTNFEGKVDADGLPHGQGKFFYAKMGDQQLQSSKQVGIQSSYSGTLENGLRHGNGEMFESHTQSTYVGDWENDLPHGFGHIEWQDGSRFTGKLVRGRLSEGAYTFSSGNHYEGSFNLVTGKFHGQGTFSNQDQIIQGEWKEGKLHGQGKRNFANGDIYEGIWVEDQLEGHGVYITHDGEYRGQFHKSLEHGQGFRKYPNGATYMGEWKSGLRNGKGLFKDPSQNLQYDGYFKNNFRDGFGIEQKNAPGYLKEGHWKNNQLDGEGRMVVYAQPDNKVLLDYRGTFKQGKFHGFGSCSKQDGVLYTGEFVENMRHGQGTLITYEQDKYLPEDGILRPVSYAQQNLQAAKKLTYVGQFINDMMDGQGVMKHEETGYVYEGGFQRNLKHGFGVEKQIMRQQQSTVDMDRRKEPEVRILYEGQFHNGVKIQTHGIIQ